MNKNRVLLFHQDLSFIRQAPWFDQATYEKEHHHMLLTLRHLLDKAHNDELSFLVHPFMPTPDYSGFMDPCKDAELVLVLAKREHCVSMKALACLLQSWVWLLGAKPRLCFLHDVDAENFWEIMSIANPAKTVVVALSPSGEDEEVLIQFMRILEYWQGMISKADMKKRIFAITANPEGRLTCVAQTFALEPIACQEVDVKGMECFVPSLMMPLILTGFDMTKFNKGAALTCMQFFKNQLKTSLEGMALLRMAQKIQGVYNHIIYPANSIFKPIADWMQYVGHAFFPTLVFNAHDKVAESKKVFYTVLFERHVARERLSPSLWKNIPSLKALSETTLRDFAQKDCQRFCHKQTQDGHFLRLLELHSLNEETLGSLFMNHVLELLLLRQLA